MYLTITNKYRRPVIDTNTPLPPKEEGRGEHHAQLFFSVFSFYVL